MNSEIVDINLYEIDWSNVSPELKKEILEYRVHCTTVSRRAIEAQGAYIANFRTLSILLMVSMGMSLYGIDNRSIVLTVASIQFIKTLLSKLFEMSMFSAVEIARKEFANFLKRKKLQT